MMRKGGKPGAIKRAFIETLEQGASTSMDLAEEIGISNKAACQMLKYLEDLGAVKRVGKLESQGNGGGRRPYLWACG